MEAVPVEQFEELVAEALDELADSPLGDLDNVVILVEDRNPEEPELLGLYDGVALTERDNYSGVLPDRIFVYRLPLCEMCEDEDDLYDEIVVTLAHEIAHHVGMDEETLHALGWG